MSVKYKIRHEHGIYFLTCPIVGWVDLFSRAIYREIVYDSWRYCIEHKGLQIHAFTIMPNHIHLIASCREPHRLTEVMRDWKHYTAKRILEYLQDNGCVESRRQWLLYLFDYFAFNKKSKQTYQVWQHDNHPVELFSETVLSQKLDYVHRNAVHAGFVELPEHWLSGSAPFYAWNAAEAPFRSEPYVPPVDIVPVWQWFYEEGPGGW